ncbi:M56 family metallopeptidase [Flavobacterium sp. MAHUQ-51]|uniref:M56 family metallopeptidase n=1 Tax=Flavobacterium sp. GCM10022190 TaxID=3252639 RepID=UPI003608CB3F
MIDFLIKSSLSLVILLISYHLLLEKEKMHQFNRFYLLFSLLFSLVIPFITIEIIKEIPQQQSNYTIAPITQEILNTPIVEDTTNYWLIAGWSIYGIITLTLLIRFVLNIWKLKAKTIKNQTVDYKKAKLVLVKEITLPYTFLNYIFINKTDYYNRKIEDELFTHELIHVHQKHTLDILFIEILKVIFWFNPIFIFYKKAIQLNHEFLADEKVVKSHNNVSYYQNLLLTKANANPTYYLASNLNYSVTKKRLIMMTKETPKTRLILKKTISMPLFIVLIFSLCLETIAQEKANIPSPKKTQSTEVVDKKRDFYYAGVRVIVKDHIRNIMFDKKYENLSIGEKRRYLGIPYPVKQNKLPPSMFESFKNKSNYAVWIDGANINNAALNNYKYSDFAHYTSSYVHKNARSKKFPQKFQCSLYTKKYFEKNIKNKHLKYENESIEITILKPQKISEKDSIKQRKMVLEDMAEMQKDLSPKKNSKINKKTYN